jgi:hypothetical protein
MQPEFSNQCPALMPAKKISRGEVALESSVLQLNEVDLDQITPPAAVVVSRLFFGEIPHEPGLYFKVDDRW